MTTQLPVLCLSHHARVGRVVGGSGRQREEKQSLKEKLSDTFTSIPTSPAFSIIHPCASEMRARLESERKQTPCRGKANGGVLTAPWHGMAPGPWLSQAGTVCKH